MINNLDEYELLTIGYCQENEKEDESLIIIIKKTDRLKIQNIKKVWRANTATNKIEIVNNLNHINCFNEWFSK
jgi:hypothetical protein